MRSLRQRRAGFSLLELAVVVAVVALLITVALERMLRYVELAEKGHMEQTIGVVRSALGLRFAGLYVQGKTAEIQALAGENPMDWLAERPPGYVGVLWDPRLADVERGIWYFERSRHVLVYVPSRTRYLVVGPDGDPRIGFRAMVDFRAPAGGSLQLERLGMEPVRPYNWFEDLE